ncbi:MAG: OmpP1/FadL family transporter [Panacagrimonas sp.]
MLALAVAPISFSADATNGYFQLGQSAEQRAMAGAGTALAGDPAQITFNPAGILGASRQFVTDLNIVYVNLNVEAGERDDSAGAGLFTLEPGRFQSGLEWFPIPVVALGMPIDEVSSWAIAIHGGGLKSKITEGSARFAEGLPLLATRCEGAYGGGPALPGSPDLAGLCGNGDPTASAGLVQLYIRPGYARQITPQVSVGISGIVVVQSVRLRGLSAFAPFSVDPKHVSDQGSPHSPVFSLGARVGIQAAPLSRVSVGASYQTRMRAEFSDYAGLLLDGGRLDIPEMWNLGLALRPKANHLLAMDFERINFSDVPSFGRSLEPNALVNRCLLPRLLAPNATSEACLGGDQGPGFGWRDVLSYRIGYRWHASDRLEVSAGYAFARQPIRRNQVLLNGLTPPTSDHHFSGGFTWRLNAKTTFNFGLMYTPDNPLTGKNPLSAVDANLVQLLAGSVGPGSAGLDDAFGPDADDQDLTISFEILELVIGLNFDW